MPTDPSIILGIQNNAPDLGAIYGNALKIRQEQLQTAQLQTELQQQNALRRILSQPDAVDPATGKISKNALLQATQASPEIGIKLANQNAQVDEREAQAAHVKSETYTNQQEMISGAAESVMDIYETALKGKHPEVAAALAQDALTERRDGLAKSGMFGEADLARIPTKFDPMQIRQYLSARDRETMAREKESETREAQTTAFQKAEIAGRTADRNLRREEGQYVGAQPYTDPVTGTPYIVYPRMKGPDRIQDLQGNPYIPQGAQKIGTDSARSGPTMILQQYKRDFQQKYGRPPSANELLDFNMQVGVKDKAAKDFATGKQGDTVRALNVATLHLQLIREYAHALNNGDVQTVNRLANRWQAEFGSAAPTNLDALAQTAGQEVTKVVVPGAGGEAERQEAGKRFQNWRSDAQIDGAIDASIGLMGGQAKGLEKQYKSTTGRDDFGDLLLPETKEALHYRPMEEDSHHAPAPSGGGTFGLSPELVGKMTQPNHTYFLKSGKRVLTDAQGHVYKVEEQ